MNAVTPIINGLVIRLYIQTKTSRDQIIGLHGNQVKIAISALPIRGQANDHLIKFLSNQFKVARGNITIEKGTLRQHKQVRIIHPKQIPAVVAALYTI